jgi:hypothetical protein
MRHPRGKTLKAFDSSGNVIGEFESTGNEQEDIRIAHAIFQKAGLHRNPPSVARQIRNKARDFLRLSFQLHRSITSLGQKCAHYLAPFAVNASFGIELYLKAIAEQNGLPLRGHKLTSLFDALPAAAIDACARIAPSLFHTYDLEQTSDIRQYLVKLDDAFIKWRYSYEYDQEPLIFPIKEALFLLHLLDKVFANLAAKG